MPRPDKTKRIITGFLIALACLVALGCLVMRSPNQTGRFSQRYHQNLITAPLEGPNGGPSFTTSTVNRYITERRPMLQPVLTLGYQYRSWNTTNVHSR